MALYTLSPQIWGPFPHNHVLRIRPAGWMPGLQGGLRSYNADQQAFAHDLQRFLSYTAEDLEKLFRPGAVSPLHENIELPDEDASYLQWTVENTKRVYIKLHITPLQQKRTQDLFTVLLSSASGQILSRIFPLTARVLMDLLEMINHDHQVQFAWQRSVSQRQPFEVITVPDLCSQALAIVGIDLNAWLTHPLPEAKPILVFADAIRSNLFSFSLQEAYRERHTFTCPHCAVSYVLVPQITDQARFDRVPPASLQPFCRLREAIQNEHPDHSAERLRSSGVTVWPAPLEAAGPVHMPEVRPALAPADKPGNGLLP